MSASTVLQGPLFAAYMVGRCKGYRDARIADARQYRDMPVKLQCIENARDWNRKVLYWLKKAQS